VVVVVVATVVVVVVLDEGAVDPVAVVGDCGPVVCGGVVVRGADIENFDRFETLG
jgi:hypothetical protein